MLAKGATTDMPLITNGDFSNGLTGWTVSQGGNTAPTVVGGEVVFGESNEVQNGDQLVQNVALEAGTEYTLTFQMTAVEDDFGGYGLNIQLQDVNGGSGFTDIGSHTVTNGETTTVTITFTSPYDNPDLIIRGQFGFGPTDPDATSALILDDFVLTCFTRGTLIRTPNGLVAVEDLEEGDLVDTLDDGPCPVRWIGSRIVSVKQAQARPEWRPVLVPAGALGDSKPTRDLLLSPCHRVLLRGARLEMVLGSDEALVAVKSLVGHIDGIRVINDLSQFNDGIEYFQILFDTHQVVWSEGAETESFHPVERTVSSFDADAKNEIMALFPELEGTLNFKMETARRVVKSYEVPPLMGS